MKDDSESLDDDNKAKDAKKMIAWPTRDVLITEKDFDKVVINKVFWCVESDFKKDCGGFKLQFKNGYDSPWCSIHSKMENE